MGQATSAVATKAKSAALAKFTDDLMDSVPVEVQDITIPKLLLQQSQSGIFKAGKSKIGEIRGSMEANLVAAPGQEVEFIPFGVWKSWVTVKAAGGAFIEEVPYDSAKLEREEVRDGVDVKNYQQLNYYCLLPGDIETGVYMPYVISFRSTSYLAGRTLETKRALLEEFGKPLPFKTFKVWSELDKNKDGNEYQIFNVAESRDTTEKELGAVQEWNRIIKTKNVVVDDSDTKQDSSPKRAAVSQEDEF